MKLKDDIPLKKRRIINYQEQSGSSRQECRNDGYGLIAAHQQHLC